MEVKGTAVIAIRDYVKINYSGEYKAWVNSLKGGSKEIFSGAIDSTSWYNAEDGALEPTVKLSSLFFEGNSITGAWESGRYSAQKALTGIYKIFVKSSSPAHIVQRASRVFAAYYRPLEMNLVSSESNSCVVEITGMTENYMVIENRIAGWIEKALEISGAKNIKLNINKKHDSEATREVNISWE